MYVCWYLQVIGYEKYSVMGWSDGGITGQIMACNYYKSIQKLIVWGSHAFYTDEDMVTCESKSGFATDRPFTQFCYMHCSRPKSFNL